MNDDDDDDDVRENNRKDSERFFSYLPEQNARLTSHFDNSNFVFFARGHGEHVRSRISALSKRSILKPQRFEYPEFNRFS